MAAHTRTGCRRARATTSSRPRCGTEASRRAAPPALFFASGRSSIALYCSRRTRERNDVAFYDAGSSSMWSAVSFVCASFTAGRPRPPPEGGGWTNSSRAGVLPPAAQSGVAWVDDVPVDPSCVVHGHRRWEARRSGARRSRALFFASKSSLLADGVVLGGEQNVEPLKLLQGRRGHGHAGVDAEARARERRRRRKTSFLFFCNGRMIEPTEDRNRGFLHRASWYTCYRAPSPTYAASSLTASSKHAAMSRPRVSITRPETRPRH